jgi:hypothetical protein
MATDIERDKKSSISAPFSSFIIRVFPNISSPFQLLRADYFVFGRVREGLDKEIFYFLPFGK